MTMENKETKKKNPPDPGRCPACAGLLLVSGQGPGYYCTSCGYMGWLTHDQYFED